MSSATPYARPRGCHLARGLWRVQVEGDGVRGGESTQPRGRGDLTYRVLTVDVMLPQHLAQPEHNGLRRAATSGAAVEVATLVTLLTAFQIAHLVALLVTALFAPALSPDSPCTGHCPGRHGVVR
ncbi:hypothetical protein [Streptomyces sp. NPDC097610]|uniref:hypothetical protein n=1 Tax=Streptomyces sp. NPDC097610 TaxID=3157227 RepID=UPI00332033AE